MTKYQTKDLLEVDGDLDNFIKTEVLPGLDISEQKFWRALAKITHDLGQRIKPYWQKQS